MPQKVGVSGFFLTLLFFVGYEKALKTNKNWLGGGGEGLPKIASAINMFNIL